ncbi:DNA polymerase III subunit chi [Bombella apis]|uniref:DNA polymerase III subunit chi n=1 Tax=Bombella apis TaxID=1785988 RepID=UPI0023F751F4|nr:DNA polymerase III subunit chi [Bombella apis]MCT6814073.1 DNA polymerase III subunit chi [Bombella apis]
MQEPSDGLVTRRVYPPQDVQVGFYHLTRTSFEAALPALLNRTFEAGERAVIRCQDAGQVKMLDEALWATAAGVWLPHGSRAMGHADRQPAWLTACDELPNGGAFLFRMNGAWDGALTGFRRIFDLFNGHDGDAVQQARLRWKEMKQAGYRLTYWQQDARGWRRAG